MKILFFIFCLFCAKSIIAQQNFQRSFGTANVERAIDVVETDQKEIVILGATYLNLNLTKIDSSGNLIWSKILPITNEYLSKMRYTTDGGFILNGSGNINNVNAGEYILKLDANGETEWCSITNNFIGPIRDVFQSLDGGYLAISDGIIMKFNAQGAISWKKKHTSTTDDNLYFRSIQQVTSDSSFIVSGYMLNDPHTISTVTISKISKTGESVWHKLIPDVYELTNVQIVENDHVVFFSRNSIMELDENGEFISKINLDNFSSFSIANGEKRGNHFLLFGTGSADLTSNGDFSVIKLDLAGNVIWVKLIGGNLTDFIACQRRSIDGGSIILGNTRSFSVGEADYLLIKSDSLESYNCNVIPGNITTFVSSNSVLDFGTTVDQNPFFNFNNVSIPNNQLINLEEHDACDCIPPVAQFEFHPMSGDIEDNSIWPGQSTFYIYDSNEVLVDEFSYVGTYTLCLSVENACGSDSICEIVYYSPMPVSTEELGQVEKKVEIITLNEHQLLIRFKSEQQNARIRLIDVTGKRLTDESFSGTEYLFGMDNVQRAMYFIQIESLNDDLRFSQKIVLGQ